MEILENKKYIPLTDKSDPDEIRAVVGMSKKTFKQAVGNLYKQRLITIEVSGIYLVE
jgi:predicted RNA-binding protein (virulence factor B family)